MFDTIKNILIIKPSALGDIVHSLPFLAVLKKRFPHARIDWVVAHGLHTFLEGHPLIDRLWVIKKDQWKKIGNINHTIKEINDLKKGLKASEYDVSIDLSGLLRSGLITYFSKAKIKLGFKESDEGSPFFYTHKIHGSMNIHAIDRYLEIAKFMGCSIDKIEYPMPPYDPFPPLLKDLPQKFVVMSPSAGKPANRWPAEKFGRLAAKLLLPTIVIASAAEADIAREVVAHSKGNAISVAGKTSLKDLVALIDRSSFFVCNDTGPMHIAAALNIPVFAVFGPANPIRTGPYGKIHTIIQKKNGLRAMLCKTTLFPFSVYERLKCCGCVQDYRPKGQPGMKLSVIITTYNRPDALKRVLDGLLSQTRLPKEIIVADDGSGPPTKTMLIPYLNHSRIRIKHVWQKDMGFRAARIRNMAIAQSKGDYLILLDGDCIPEKHFIKDHLDLAQKGCFFQGKRVLVNPSIEKKFNHRTCNSTTLLMMRALKKEISNCHHIFRIPFFPSYTTGRLSGVRSCNMGMFRDDIWAVNGFNHDFEGWGREDSELVVRLFKYGLKRKENPFKAICFHLWHHENKRNCLEKNDKMLKQAGESKSFFCKSGLNEFL